MLLAVLVAHATAKTLCRASYGQTVVPTSNSFDDVFHEQMPPPSFDEATILRIVALLVDAAPHDLSNGSAHLYTDDRLLRQLTERYCELPHEVLTLQTRFVRGLTVMLVGHSKTDCAAIPTGSHDRSYFVRDANRALCMAPHRSLAIDDARSPTCVWHGEGAAASSNDGGCPASRAAAAQIIVQSSTARPLRRAHRSSGLAHISRAHIALCRATGTRPRASRL